MEFSPKEIAEQAMSAAPDDDTARLILDLGNERARSQHLASMALDQRITQAAVLQFAAAAVAATLAGGEGVPTATRGLAALGAVAFVIGAAICFRGVKSSPLHAPGLPPGWWHKIADHEKFELRHAMCWAAGAIQEALDKNAEEDEVRARHLNLSLCFGLAGAAFVVGAALMRLIV